MGVRDTVSNLLHRMRWASLLGYQQDGRRDLYKTFGYNRHPKFEDYLGRYQRQDVARRVIEAPARATWADPPQMNGDDVFMAAWDELVRSQKVWHKLSKVDILAGIGHFAVLVIGTDDGQRLEQPANPNKRRKITYLQPYMEASVSIVEWETSQSSPRFGLPVMYEIRPEDTAIDNSSRRQDAVARGAARSAFKVHHTRILHIADNTLENPVYGASRLEPIYNLLDDLLKVVGGASETYWLTANRGLQIDVDKEIDLLPEDAENLAAEVEEYEHNLRRTIRTRGVTVRNLGSDVADPRGTFEVVISMISVSTGIPKRVLMGSEAGQLASAQDRANWAQRMAERAADFAEPVVLLPFIAQCIQLGVLPTPKDLSIVWPEAFKLSPLERAQTSAQMARSVVNVIKGLVAAREGGLGDVFTPEEARTIVGFGKHMPVFDADQSESGKKTAEDPINAPSGTESPFDRATGEVSEESVAK